MNEKKLYHTIGQVSEFTDLPQSVLRYWETVFPRFNPKKSPGGNCLYTDDDVQIIQKIKELLYVQKFTIQGANAQLERDGSIKPNLNTVKIEENKARALAGKRKHSLSLSKKELQDIVDQLKQIIISLDD